MENENISTLNVMASSLQYTNIERMQKKTSKCKHQYTIIIHYNDGLFSVKTKTNKGGAK